MANIINVVESAKKSIADHVEGGFYAGVGAAVGVVAVCTAPEIITAAVVGVVAYKAGQRLVSKFKK